MQDQIRTKFQCLSKGTTVTKVEKETALMAQNNMSCRFKRNCNVSGKMGHKSTDCWEKKCNKQKQEDF